MDLVAGRWAVTHRGTPSPQAEVVVNRVDKAMVHSLPPLPFSIVATTRSARYYMRQARKGGAEESRWIEMKVARLAGSVILKMMTSSALHDVDDLRYGSGSGDMGTVNHR